VLPWAYPYALACRPQQPSYLASGINVGHLSDVLAGDVWVGEAAQMVQVPAPKVGRLYPNTKVRQNPDLTGADALTLHFVVV